MQDVDFWLGPGLMKCQNGSSYVGLLTSSILGFAEKRAKKNILPKQLPNHGELTNRKIEHISSAFFSRSKCPLLVVPHPYQAGGTAQSSADRLRVAELSPGARRRPLTAGSAWQTKGLPAIDSFN